MGKIAKYLAQAWPATLIVFLLLVVQAFCDLRLPQYTSDIVDVGIGQGGIEYAAPEKLREETYEDLSLFMTAEERNTVAGAYRQEEDGIYELVSGDKETCEKIDEAMKLLRPLLPIRFEKSHIAIKLNGSDYGRCYDDIIHYGLVEKEEWTADGSWIGVMEIPAGLINEITDKLKHKTKGSASVKLIN